MDVRKVTEDSEDGPWEAGRGKPETEKRTRRQRKSLVMREGNGSGGETNYGKVLRSHTRRNTEKTAATEWVSSRCQDSERSSSALRQDEDHAKGDHHNNKNDDNVGERRKEIGRGGGTTAEIASVISLSSSCQASSNERKIPPEEAELGGTTSKLKATIEDAHHAKTGSSSTHKGSTMKGEVGRARKSERNEASLSLQSSPCSNEIAPTSLPRADEAITTQHSKLNSIVGCATATTTIAAGGYGCCKDKDEIYSFEESVCSAEECRREEMSDENARRSPKQSTCSATQRIEIGCETRFQSNVTGGSVGSSHWSPPDSSFHPHDQDEEKKVFQARRPFKTDEDELATSLKTLACVGKEERKFEECDHKNSVCKSYVEINCELAENDSSESISGHSARRSRNYASNDDDNEEEWQAIKKSNNEKGELEERILLEKEKSRIVLSPCRRTSSNMIQGGVEATPGTEAPFAEVALRTTPSPQSVASGSPVTSPKKKNSSIGSNKKRSVSEKVNDNPGFFKFKKPQQNKKNQLDTRGDDKSAKKDHAVSGDSSVGDSLRSSSVEHKRAQVSSAYMNNLPYMGELTFDTRPRRGRKPKKADICHLISKNYGIHFPSATQDTRFINQEPQRPCSSGSVPTATRTKLEQGPKSKQLSRASSVQQNATRCSPTARPLLLPSAPVPAFYNRDVSIVPIIPSAWNTGKGADSSRDETRQGMTTDTVSTHHFTLHRGITTTANSQETISMFPLNPQTRGIGKMLASPNRTNSDEGNSDESGMDVDSEETSSRKDDRDQDMPLNLCLRDDTGGKGSFLETLSLSSINAALDVRWRKGLALRLNPDNHPSSSESISPTISIIPGGNRPVEFTPLKNMGSSAYTRKLASESNQVNLVSGKNLLSSSTRRNSSTLSGIQAHINSPEISVSVKNASPDDISQLTFSHRIEKQLASGGKEESHSAAKQISAKRKKDLVTRPTINSSICPSPSNSTATSNMMSYSTVPSANSTPLSSLGGRLFGQSSSDGAEVSICKFKFTGGAKPSLQEKKMLSVDSGGNFRFYTDKANNGITTKLCKGHQFAVSSSTPKTRTTETASNMGKRGVMVGDLSVRPELSPSFSLMQDSSGKSFSQTGSYCESESKLKSRKGSTSSTMVKSGSKRSMYSAPPISWSSASGASQSDPFSLLPTRDREDGKYLRLSMEGDQGATTSSSCGALQYQEDTNSSSNTCSSSDESNESSRDTGKGFDVTDRTDPDFAQLSQKHFQKHRSSPEKLKLRGKRRTRKSLMREKLEKTFKEKGFLIQTQQLESAEGATYCKFRQLRKFTRYLFRSWKDYLPDTVKEISDNSARGQPGKEAENASQTNANPEERESPSEGSIFQKDEGKADLLPQQHNSQEEEIDVEEEDDAADEDDADD